MRRLLRHSILLPAILTAVCAAGAWLLISPAAAVALLALALLEIAMATDSSVPMAGIASRIGAPARRLFLSVGIVAGVLAMRILLPPAAVAVGTPLSPTEAATEALLQPTAFAADLESIRPGLAAFGAVFIWLVFTEYLFNVDRLPRRAWLGRGEAVLASASRPRVAAVGTAVVGAAALVALVDASLRPEVAIGAAIGLAAYLVVKSIGAFARRRSGRAALHVHAATVVFERGLTVFMLFEILDGVYTLQAQDTGLGLLEEGVVAACGVGIGAIHLARLTSSVDGANGLTRLRYLKAGAAYVLGVLSVLLGASLVVPVPGVVAAWFGTLIIGAALITSIPRRVLLHRAGRMGARIRDLVRRPSAD